jgi:3-deoxy-D-manno-octulosonic-acid transferase
MGLARLLFNTVFVLSVVAVYPVVSRLHPGVRRHFDHRRGAMERWDAASRAVTARPRLWIHAASAGESLQAQPLVEALRARLPSAAFFVSWWSPSARHVIERWPVDYADTVPFEVPRRMRAMMRRIAPDALLFVGTGTLPNFVWAASDAGVRVGHAGCRLGSRFGRGGMPVSVLREVYPRLDAVAVPREEDAEWARAIGVAPEAVAVTGDPRVDATFGRLERDAPAPWSRSSGDGPVIVAGSTHASDMPALLPAIARLRRRYPGLVTLVAPRDPTPQTVDAIEAGAAREGLPCGRLSAGSEGRPAIVVVDTLGVLYRLYAAADVAYVGGAFHGSVHNTMEPAAHGVPVVIGPRPGAFHEVEDLREAGALRSAASAEELEAALDAWLGDSAARAAAGGAARATIEQHRGATERTIAFLAERGFPVG